MEETFHILAVVPHCYAPEDTAHWVPLPLTARRALQENSVPVLQGDLHKALAHAAASGALHYFDRPACHAVLVYLETEKPELGFWWVLPDLNNPTSDLHTAAWARGKRLQGTIPTALVAELHLQAHMQALPMKTLVHLFDEASDEEWLEALAEGLEDILAGSYVDNVLEETLPAHLVPRDDLTETEPLLGRRVIFQDGSQMWLVPGGIEQAGETIRREFRWNAEKRRLDCTLQASPDGVCGHA